MTEQTIDVTGLPEGWKAVAIRKCCIGDYWFNFDTKEVYQSHSFIGLALIVQKIQPRRIVLEETEEKYLGCQTLYIDGTEIMIMTNKTWREVKETDIPLTNEDADVKSAI